MRRVQISSGTILSIGYEAATLTLELELFSGDVFQFYHVPLTTYIGLMNADPKGDYFQHHIKAMFESKQVTEGVAKNNNGTSRSITN